MINVAASRYSQSGPLRCSIFSLLITL